MSARRIRADFAQRVALDTDALPWVPSPTPGVERRLLDRVGDEVARATSLVRYAPDSRFPAHEHGMGEEFLVLEGTFSDEHDDYPAGTYVRNPWGSRHAPFTREGCVLFVKLRQMSADDRARVCVKGEGAWAATDRAGVERRSLHRFGAEEVQLERWAPGAEHVEAMPGGAELLVLDGTLVDDFGTHGVGAWQRMPPGTPWSATSGSGCVIWIKRGHLAEEVVG